MTETFYEVLSVPSGASREEIEAAYRARVKETHPDVSDAPDAEDEFKRVTRARDVLTDEDERATYDRLGHDRYVERVLGGPGVGADTDDTADAAGAGTASSDDRTADDTAAAGGGRAGTGTESRGSRTGSDTNRQRTGADATGTADASATTGDSTDGAATGRYRQSRRGGEETTYATQTEYTGGSSDSVRLPLTPRTVILMGTMSLLYPVFVVASVLPAFPMAVNVVVALCTLAVVAYLVSMPNVAVVVFGVWSVLAPLLLLGIGGLSLFSPVGLLVPVAAWFPFCLALLTRAALRP
jgi:curved DNA-binding protein CbpA